MEQKHKFDQFKRQPRLPKFAVPKRYDLKLKPDLAAYKFSGTVDVTADTKFIVLNAAELSVDSNSVQFGSQDASKQGESHINAMLRGELLAALAKFGHDVTLKEGRKRFHAFLDDRDTPLLPPDIGRVRSQDIVFGLAVSREGCEIAWKWMKDNWDHISKTFGSGFLITRFVCASVSPFTSIEKAKEVEEFFATRAKASIARTLKQSLERIRINAKWVESIQNEKHLAEAIKELACKKY